MAGIGNGGNTPRLPGSNGGGENPFEKKDVDVLNPEEEAKSKGKKGIGQIVNSFKKIGDFIKKLINLIKVHPYVAIAIVIIIIGIGIIGFFQYMPGLMIGKLKEFGQGALDTVESWFTTDADAYINPDDVVELANYLEEMEYDLIGYGFLVPTSEYANDMGYLTTGELAEQGYIYFERRGDDENARYYSQSSEEDPEGNSAYQGFYYNSLGILIDNSTGQMYSNDSEYIDQFGIIRSTEEFANNGEGKIIKFANDWLSDALDWNIDTTLLRTYLLSDYKIYSIRNNETGLLNNIYATIKQTFGGYDSAWAKGLIKFYEATDGIAESEWSSSLGHWIVYGDDISIQRTSTGAKMTVKKGHFNNPMVFSIDGWADRYGMSLEFLLSLHIATMQPDLVYAMLQSFDTEVQVYLEDSGDSQVDAAYVDMLNEEASVDNDEDRITINDVEETLSEGDFDVASWAVNDMAATEWVNGLAITKKNAQYLLTHLPLKSPPNCTGQAQDQIIVLATDDTVFGWRWASTNSLNTYGISSETEAQVYDIFDEYEEYYYTDASGNQYIMSADNCDASLGTDDEAYLDDNYSFFEDDDSGVNLSDYGYTGSNVDVTGPETNEIETMVMQPMIVANTTVFDIYKTKEVRTTRTYSAEVDGEEVEYEWITIKYLVYKTGTETVIVNGILDEPTDPIRDDWDEEDYEWVDTIVFEFIIRDKTTQELVDAGLLIYDEATDEYIPVDPATTRCSDDPDLVKCCKNCKNYVKDVIQALGAISDQDYASYTPYIARVLGSWFRDTYFIIPDYADTAIQDYTNESNRSSSEMSMINNSYGENSALVNVDEEYLAETGEYWTAYEMNGDDYQLFYLYPNGITSDYKVEDFIADPYTALESYQTGYAARYNITQGMTYSSQEDAEDAGHAFVKKASTRPVTELSNTELEDVLWSAYEFSSDGAATGWIRVEYEDDNSEVNDVYDTIGEEYPNSEGGFYYNITSTNEVTQVEDAQRSETNPTVKWLFKYRKYYSYDGTRETALKISADEEAVLNWAENYLRNNYSTAKNVANNLLGKYGRSAIRQTYSETFYGNSSLLVSAISTLSFDWEDVTEQWLDWQLDMYYSGIVEDEAANDFVLDDLAFIVTKDDDGNITSIRETTDLEYEPGENEEVRIGDPRNPDLIRITNITKSSLEAFTILENTKTLASEYAYRDFKELIVELDYFDKEDLSDAIQSVFTWVLPEVSPIGWPVRPYDKQNTEYGALIGSHGTYEALGVSFAGGSSGNANQIIQSAISEAEAIANDNSIGYTNGTSNADNMGEVDGDMNCLGFVVNAYSNAGAPEAKEYILEHGVSNFSQVGDALTASGFEDITSQVDLSASSFEETNLQKGDLVWRWNRDSTGIHGHIAMIYDDDGTIIEATSDIDGVQGDSTGGEIAITGGWRAGEFMYALRYTGTGNSSSSSSSSSSDSSSSSSNSSSTSNSSSSSSVDISKIQFVGDSWIDGLSAQNIAESSYFYGVTGASAASSSMSIDSINVRSDASAIVLYLGVNNTSSASSMNNLIDSLISRYNIPVYVVKVTHVGTAYSNASTMNSNIDSYNSSVQAHCNSTDGAYFIDATSGLQDSNGYLSSSYATGDGLHLNSTSAYQIWYNNIISGINSGSSGMSIVEAAREVAEMIDGWSYGSNHDDLSLETREVHETDCSGYVTAVLIKAGYFDQSQMGSREPGALEYWNHGTENVYSNPSGWGYVSQKLQEMEMVADTTGGNGYVSEDQLQPGDIVALAHNESDNSQGGHVAIYMGDGKIYEVTGGVCFQERDYSNSEWTRAYRVTLSSSESNNQTSFQGYEGGELVSSPVTGKVIEYGTHIRTNVYTGDSEEVGYIVIEAISSSESFTADNVANNSGDTENVDNEAAAEGLNLFYDEYEENCSGYTITIDGFKVDLNATDSEGNNGVYEQNEVYALYNSEEQGRREEIEQKKDDAPFFVNYGESADLGSLPDEYINESNSSEGYYIKEGKYIGITYTDEESAALTIETEGTIDETTGEPVEVEEEENTNETTETEEETETTTTTEEYTGPANYIRIIVKDREYSIIDNIEDYFDIPEPEGDSSTGTGTGEYGDLEAITESSSDTEKVRAAMTYFVSQGFTPEGAAGIMGNLIQESALDPAVVSASGYHGLAQWNTSDAGGHWWDASDGIRAWVISQGYNETDYAGQIRAIYEAERRGQMTEALWAELKALTNIEQATELFAVYYEGCVGGSDPTQWYDPGTNYQELNNRKRYAQNAYDIYMGDDSKGIKD